MAGGGAGGLPARGHARHRRRAHAPAARRARRPGRRHRHRRCAQHGHPGHDCRPGACHRARPGCAAGPAGAAQDDRHRSTRRLSPPDPAPAGARPADSQPGIAPRPITWRYTRHGNALHPRTPRRQRPAPGRRPRRRRGAPWTPPAQPGPRRTSARTSSKDRLSASTSPARPCRWTGGLTGVLNGTGPNLQARVNVAVTQLVAQQAFQPCPA